VGSFPRGVLPCTQPTRTAGVWEYRGNTFKSWKKVLHKSRKFRNCKNPEVLHKFWAKMTLKSNKNMCELGKNKENSEIAKI
jgi:hypothetical protein